MIVSVNKTATYMIRLLTTLLFVSFLVFESFTWGKYAFLLICLGILFFGFIRNRSGLPVRFSAYFFLNLLFTFYVLLSSLWAIEPSDSLIMARTLLRTFVCAYAVYLVFVTEKDSIALLKPIKWSGYIIAMYAIYYYGLNTVISACFNDSLRLENAFSNVNSIGLLCALTCLIQMFELITNKIRLRSLAALLMIPTLTMMAATQSRKAIVFLIIGILGLIWIWIKKSTSDPSKRILKIFGSLIIIALVGILFLQLSIFNGIRERMIGLIGALFGSDQVDSSTEARNSLIDLGMEYFWKNPILGIGIANPHILAREYVGHDYYLHNNFVELLCGGGIIGFVLYYAMYVYLFGQLWKYRKIDRLQTTFFAVWLMLMLAMNYGMVTYYSKMESFYLMIHFANIAILQRKARTANE